MTLISDLEIIQGDNSPTEQFTVRDSEGSIINVADVNWVGTYNIRSENITGVVISTGTLLKGTITPTMGGSYQVFEWRLDPADTATLAPGRYFLTMQIANTTLPDPVSQEIVQADLRILPGGI